MDGKLFYLYVLLAWSVTLASAQTDCQDVGVVVVASVFGTLAVVLIVLGIVGFLLWKRRRGKLANDLIYLLSARNNLTIRRSRSRSDCTKDVVTKSFSR